MFPRSGSGGVRRARSGTLFVEERTAAPGADDRARSWDSTPVSFEEITGADAPRTPTGIAEFDRVLGGGVVAGALILLGGDPGVGKSTLMLDVASQTFGANESPLRFGRGVGAANQIAG